MPWVLNLTDVLQFVVDGFYDRPLAEEDFLPHAHQLVLHVAPDTCYQMYPFIPKNIEQFLWDVPLVGEQVSEQFAAQHVKHSSIPVIHIAFRQAEVQQFATVIADQMEFEAIKPTHCTFAQLCHSLEYSIGTNALIMADGNPGGIHEADSGAGTETDQADEHH